MGNACAGSLFGRRSARSGGSASSRARQQRVTRMRQHQQALLQRCIELDDAHQSYPAILRSLGERSARALNSCRCAPELCPRAELAGACHAPLSRRFLHETAATAAQLYDQLRAYASAGAGALDAVHPFLQDDSTLDEVLQHACLPRCALHDLMHVQRALLVQLMHFTHCVPAYQQPAARDDARQTTNALYWVTLLIMSVTDAFTQPAHRVLLSRQELQTGAGLHRSLTTSPSPRAGGGAAVDTLVQHQLSAHNRRQEVLRQIEQLNALPAVPTHNPKRDDDDDDDDGKPPPTEMVAV